MKSISSLTSGVKVAAVASCTKDASRGSLVVGDIR
jgi:hypothetical protein